MAMEPEYLGPCGVSELEVSVNHPVPDICINMETPAGRILCDDSLESNVVKSKKMSPSRY